MRKITLFIVGGNFNILKSASITSLETKLNLLFEYNTFNMMENFYVHPAHDCVMQVVMVNIQKMSWI